MSIEISDFGREETGRADILCACAALSAVGAILELHHVFIEIADFFYILY